MADKLELRPAAPDDTGAVLELMRVSLGEGTIPRQEEYWNWKHRDGPFGPSPCLLAISEGVIVGIRVFMRWEWRAHGRAWPAVRAVDTATHPEWRGRGIFSRLTRALAEELTSEGVAFIFNTPNEKSRPGYLKMGWHDVGRVSLSVRPVHPLRLVWRLAGAGRNGHVRPAPDREPGRPIENFLAEPRLAPFLEGLAPPATKLATPRTPRYLRWRYADIPGFRYRAAWDLTEDGGAAVIFRIRRDRRWTELRVCDMLASSGSAGRARRLLKSVLRGGDADLAAGMGRNGTAKALLRCGFVPAPGIGPRMTVRPLNWQQQRIDLLDRSSWDLSIGDLELF